MSSQICLKWNSFLNNIAKSFENLWEEEGLVDVTLACNGRCLTAHKVILSASSPFFKKVFETNPCQHPVIILQDVNYNELEALLIFIYKGEVNIEQEQLPALLKTAETLQIRGLSAGDICSNESPSKRLAEWDNQSSDTTCDPMVQNNNTCDELPLRKKHKNSRSQSGNLITEKSPLPSRKSSSSQSTSSSESWVNDKLMDNNCVTQSLSRAVYQRLEIKMILQTEPFETITDNLRKQVETDSGSQLDSRLNTEQNDQVQGTESSSTEINIDNNHPTVNDNFNKGLLLYTYQRLPYSELLPPPEVISTWATSRPMDHLACDLMKILFTPDERIRCNVNGKMGKEQFDSEKIHLIREVLLHFSDFNPNSVEWEEMWKNCVTKIDTSNRGFKRYLFQRKAH